MELGKEVVTREPIVFNRSGLPKGFDDIDDGMHAAFAFNRVSLGNDLETAVAISDGISEEGVLDMERLASVEKVAEYLGDRQGQPFILVDIAFDREESGPQDMQYMTGYIATVGATPNPVGLHMHSSLRRPGIAVTEGYTDLHGYCDGENAYSSQYLTDIKSSVIPLNSQTVVVGVPGGNAARYATRDFEYRQEIVAGEDIIPWIEDVFSDTNAYRFYRDVIFSLVRHNTAFVNYHSELDSLLAEPYISMARKELSFLSNVEEELNRFQGKVRNLRMEIQGEIGRSNTRLSTLAEEFFGLGVEIPRTGDSYPISITAPLDGVEGEKVAERLRAMSWYKEPLSKLVLGAAARDYETPKRTTHDSL